MKDLQRISFVSGLALDKGEDIELTYQILLPQNSAATSNSEVPKTILVHSKGQNLLEAVSNVSLKEDPIYSEHLKVFLIGENLAKEESLKGLINHFIRDDEVRRSTYVFLTRDKASDVIKLPVKKKISSQKIFDLSESIMYNGKILPPVTLGKTSQYLQSNTSFFIQVLKKSESEIIYDGAGIIDGRKEKLVGFISSNDTQSLQWLTGSVQGGVVPAQIGEKPLTFEILSLKRKIIPYLKNGTLYFKVFLKASGKLSEDWDSHENSFEKKYAKQVQNIIEKEMQQNIKSAMRTLQENYQIDPIQLGTYVHNRYPTYWRNHKKNWDEIFSKTPIHYNIKVKVINFGTKGIQ